MAFTPPHSPLMTTQEYLNLKAGTNGLTKQQCLQILAGPAGQGMTGQDAANNYAGTTGRTIRGALLFKDQLLTGPIENITSQEAAFLLFP